MLVNTSIHDCMDAVGRATQEAKAEKSIVLTGFWHAPERQLNVFLDLIRGSLDKIREAGINLTQLPTLQIYSDSFLIFSIPVL